ncbi:hypothetical protein PC116_g9349 [Phytophthora cactorum]|nr:hypothetical protein PC111_g5271 [Phytophthora cactorum]KAG2918807.1 hypothetical protein PC114_g6698 [Phytophthora cactorum]KAG4242748.1 hypothetical protein PC116_g9349 [Phytophthora cactorum]
MSGDGEESQSLVNILANTWTSTDEDEARCYASPSHAGTDKPSAVSQARPTSGNAARVFFENPHSNTEDRRSLELLLRLTLLSMELKRRIYAKSVGNVQAKADLENLRKTLYVRISVNIKMSNPVLWQG